MRSQNQADQCKQKKRDRQQKNHTVPLGKTHEFTEQPTHLSSLEHSDHIRLDIGVVASPVKHGDRCTLRELALMSTTSSAPLQAATSR